MDGCKEQPKQSLQFKLSAWLAVTIAVVAVAAGGFAFVSAYQEANEMQDEQLRQMALVIGRQTPSSPSADSAEAHQASDSDFRVVVQEIKSASNGGAGGSAVTSGELAGLAPNSPEGLQTVFLQDESWRVFVKTLSSGARVAAGQPTELRDDIAQASALRTLVPFGALFLILVFLVGYLTRQMFKPLKVLSTHLDDRDEHDLAALSDAGVPTEIRPFVVAINQLLLRVDKSVAAQRRFVADAAHELRSPLTALSLQAERLAETELPAEATRRLATLRKGIERNRSLLNQLLTLARVQEPAQQSAGPVSIQSVYREVLEDLMPLAEAKSIDLGVVSPHDYSVMATPAELQTLVKNLVDNAIRHTPCGGRVDLSVDAVGSATVLEVTDTGSGIAESERQRVFEAFYRGLGQDDQGSGLGLSIVKTIADRLGAKVQLSFTDEAQQTGLRVRVSFLP